jgi:hypothetical protein
MVGAGVEALGEGTPRERGAEHRQWVVRRGAEQQQPTRAQHTPQLREPAGRVGDVLDRLTGPHRVERVVRQRPAVLALEREQLQVRAPRVGAAQRQRRDVDPHHLDPLVRQSGGEPALAAAHVQQPFAGVHVLAQEGQTLAQERRLKTLGDLLPEAFVEVSV